MKKCKNCLFWKIESWHDKDWGCCTQTVSIDGNPVVSKTLAVARDYESYGASTHTYKTFGCAMHETKELD